MNKMDNSKFKTELQKLIEKDPTLRPFVCDGYPLECDIFIVGINPATSSETKFFDYWNGDMFDKAKWVEQYKKERKANGKRELSPTRKKIEFLVNDVFHEFKCLETNAYSFATKDVKALTKENKNTDILSFLLRSIKPKALFIHGSDPTEFIKKELNISFPSFKSTMTEKTISPLVYEWEFGKLAICATKHLRLVKKEVIKSCADELVMQIKKLS